MSDTKEIYGIRVVPEKDKNGLPFGGFEGILINCTVYGFDSIEIMKLVTKENSYFAESFMQLPFNEVCANSQKSGSEKAKFLYSKAKEFAPGDEEIAICEKLVPHLRLLDSSWVSFCEKLAERVMETG